jgi:putative spermidine/putrescine transport system permease protein
LRLNAFRAVVLVVLGAFFLIPIGAMLEFSTRGVGENAARTLNAWQSILSDRELTAAIVNSLALAAITSAAMLILLVPTMVWVRLRVPGISRVIEFLCLLPLTIPAIVLVVGLSPIYVQISGLFGDSPLPLAFAYVILVLPYSYRALDTGLSALDVKTLSEAARSLGAGWFTVMLRVIVPNMSGALLNAGLLSVALVLGEYTIAQNLLYNNVMQVAIAMLGRANAGVSIAVAVASLLFAFMLLLVLSFVGRARRVGTASQEA